MYIWFVGLVRVMAGSEDASTRNTRRPPDLKQKKKIHNESKCIDFGKIMYKTHRHVSTISFPTFSRQKSHCRSRSGTRFSELGTRFHERGGGQLFIFFISKRFKVEIHLSSIPSLAIIYRVFFFTKFCWLFLNSVSTATALVFYLPVVCKHTDTEGIQRKARVWNI